MTKRSKCGTSRVVNAGLLSGEGRGYNKVRKVELNTQSGTVKVRMQKYSPGRDPLNKFELFYLETK